jgi:UDP:flavonoid glycosyltransferase YjiC (YdhE family)
MNDHIVTQLAGKKILFASVPMDGHFNPLTGLAKYLQSLQCDVRWYSSASYGSRLKILQIPHYAFVEAKEVNSQNLEELLPQRKLISDPMEKINFDFIHLFWSRSVEYLIDIKAIAITFDFDILICDNLFSAIPLIKQAMGRPVVAIGVMPLIGESLDLAPNGMGLTPPQNEQERQTYAAFRKLAREVWFKQSNKLFKNLLEANGVRSGDNPVALLTEAADLLLQIGCPGLEYQRCDLPKHIQFIGALMPHPSDESKPAWQARRMDKYQKTILVTQGTVEQDFTKLLEPTLDALKEREWLIIATGGSATATLREMYPQENIVVLPSIPFDQVMPHVDVFITNGGYGGVLQSISYGIPMVTAGIHEGKNEICSRVGYFKVGINLNHERPDASQISQAVDTLLNDPCYYTNIATLKKELATYPTLELCARHLAALLGLLPQL